MAGELLRGLAVAGAFVLILVAAEYWHRTLLPPVEWTRKFAHCAGGVVVAAFPWTFASPWSVAVLALSFAVVMRWTRRAGLLQGVHGVGRRSEGDLYYMLAVCLLFWAGHSRPVFYLISILVLGLADTAAALLGSRYGKWRYSVEGGTRTLEGSGVFFLTAFLSVHLPLLLLTDVDRAACVLISIQLALLVTSFEAISVRGNDNLVVPLATYFLLVKMTPQSAEGIMLQLAAQGVIFGILALVAWRSRLFTLSGVVAAHLFFYGAFALGGPEWLVAPALALAACVAEWSGTRPRPDARWQVPTVFYTGLSALLLYAADDFFETLLPARAGLSAGHPFFAPFVGVVAAQLAILLHLRWKGRRPRSAAPAWAWAAGLVVPAGLAAGPGGLSPVSLAGAGLVSVGGIAAYCCAGAWGGERRPPSWELRLQAASVGAAAAGLLPLVLWWGGRGH